jgi:hypothetical protein
VVASSSVSRESYSLHDHQHRFLIRRRNFRVLTESGQRGVAGGECGEAPIDGINVYVCSVPAEYERSIDNVGIFVLYWHTVRTDLARRPESFDPKYCRHSSIFPTLNTTHVSSMALQMKTFNTPGKK